MSPNARAALDAATRRLILALGHVRRLEITLSSDETARAVIGDVDLAAFIPKRNYALSALALISISIRRCCDSPCAWRSR